MAVDPPNTPSLCRYNYIQYMSSSSINTTGRNSPPPGFHHDQIPMQPFHMVRVRFYSVFFEMKKLSSYTRTLLAYNYSEVGCPVDHIEDQRGHSASSNLLTD